MSEQELVGPVVPDGISIGADVGVRVHSPQLNSQSVAAKVLLPGAQLADFLSSLSFNHEQGCNIEAPFSIVKSTPPGWSRQASVGAGVVGGTVGVPVVGCGVGKGVGVAVVGLGVGILVGFGVGARLGLIEGLLVIQRSGPTKLKKHNCSSIHVA